MTVVSAATLPYQFNPMPHPSILHKMPELGIMQTHPDAEAARVRYHEGYGEIYDESGSLFGVDIGDKDFKVLRLGRLVMGEAALTYALQEKGVRYGFRFLYNPTTLTGGQNVGTEFVPDPSDTVPAVLQEGLEVLSFQLLINRVPEVHGEASGGDYPIPVSDFDMDQMRTRGTHYDLDFLYRCCNGLHNTTYRQATGDIGILLPNPMYFYMGPFKTRGAIMQIVTNDTMFSGDMIPMMTYVNIAFSRYLTMAPTDEEPRASFVQGVLGELAEDTPTLSFAALLQGAASRAAMTTISAPSVTVPVSGTGGTGTSGSGSGGSTSGPPAGKLTGAQVQQVARDVGLDESGSRIMTQIAWAESGWNSRAHNATPPDNSYGLWQINMYGSNEANIKSKVGISSNDELFVPAINAKAMKLLYNGGRGLSNWSVYTSGKYKGAPAW